MEFSNEKLVEILLNQTSTEQIIPPLSSFVQYNLSVLFISLCFLLVIIFISVLFYFQDKYDLIEAPTIFYKGNVNFDIEKGHLPNDKNCYEDSLVTIEEEEVFTVYSVNKPNEDKCVRCATYQNTSNFDNNLQTESYQNSNTDQANDVTHSPQVESPSGNGNLVSGQSNDLAESCTAHANNVAESSTAHANNYSIHDNEPLSEDVSQQMALLDISNNNNNDEGIFEDDQPEDYISDLNNNNITDHILEFNFMMFELIQTIQEVNSGITEFVIAFQQTEMASTDITPEEFNEGIDRVNRTIQIINGTVNSLNVSMEEYAHVNHMEENNNNNNDLHNFHRQRTLLNPMLLELNQSIQCLNDVTSCYLAVTL